MKKLFLIFILFILLSSTYLFSDVCTVWYYLKNYKTGEAEIYYDYGNGKKEIEKGNSLTDVILKMEANGWKLEHFAMIQVSVPNYGLVFRK